MIKTAAVIGHPVAHSLSPVIFSFLAKTLGQTHFNYEAIDVSPENFNEFIQLKKTTPSTVGLNVTIPYKERIFDFVNELSPEAKAIGAINVVAFFAGQMKGYNTDILGIQDSFMQNAVDLQAKTVIIFGAGGAARAAAYTSGLCGASCVIICNRHQARATALAAEYNQIFKSTKFTAVGATHDFKSENAQLIIQATSLGMSGQPAALTDFEIFKSLLQSDNPGSAFAFDLVYRPEKTEFLKYAEEKGFKTIAGLTMLIGQALATWEIWFGPIIERQKVSDGLTLFLRAQLVSAP